MKRLRWTEALATGLAVIDEQHEETSARINRFLDVCAKMGGGRATLLPTFRHLESYVVEHFDFEESLMLEYDYPKTAEHQQAHQEFRKWVEETGRCVADAAITSNLVLDVNYRLTDHLKVHFQAEDKELTIYLRNLAETRQDSKLLKLFRSITGR